MFEDEDGVLMSVDRAGEVLGISRSAAFRAAAKGQLPTIRLGRRLYVSRFRLEQLLGVETDSTVLDEEERAIRRFRAQKRIYRW